MIEYRLASISWVDIAHLEDCDSLAEALKVAPVPMQTLGYVLEDTPEKLVMASTIVLDSTPTSFRCVSVIPKQNVLHITYLQEALEESPEKGVQWP